jgi:hypothetical protein
MTVRAKGNLFIGSLGPAVRLTASRMTSGPATTLQFSGQTKAVTLAAATTGNGEVFSVGSGEGGTIHVKGDQVIFKDNQGTIVGQHTFDPGDDIQGNVDSVINANVPPPSPKIVAAFCALANVTSVSNSEIFQIATSRMSVSGSGFSTDDFQLLAIKTTEVDCTMKAVTTHTTLDVVGEHDGQDFQAISTTPPIKLTAPPDDTGAPPPIAEGTSTVDPKYAALLPPQVPPSGKGKVAPAATAQSFNGSYTGTYAGTYVNSMGTFSPGGAFEFMVKDGVITMTAPGSGSGHVSASGSAGVNANNATMGAGGLSVSGLNVDFTGQFSVSGTTKMATGTWQASGAPDGGTGSGTWAATSQ